MKRLLKCFVITVVALICLAIILLAICTYRTKLTQDDISSIYNNEKYHTPIKIENVDVITQDISCGYAVIEMFSNWDDDDVTEKSLYKQYGKVVTSTGKKFCQEMNKQFPEYTTEMHKYVKNSEFIDIMYDTLADGKPVPFEWAALYGDQWTLHYSLIVGADIPNDKITVANPYGYYEEITVEELLARTSFEAYEDMPLFMKMGFAIGLFEKNTIYSVKDNDELKSISYSDLRTKDIELINNANQNIDCELQLLEEMGVTEKPAEGPYCEYSSGNGEVKSYGEYISEKNAPIRTSIYIIKQSNYSIFGVKYGDTYTEANELIKSAGFTLASQEPFGSNTALTYSNGIVSVEMEIPNEYGDSFESGTVNRIGVKIAVTD